MFCQQLLYGLTLGSMYALLAVGYSLVYGVLRMVNFAHGDLLMIACYGYFYLTRYLLFFGFPLWLCIPLLLLFCGFSAKTIEMLCYRPLRKSGGGALIVAAIAVSLLSEHLATLLFSADPKLLPPLLPSGHLFAVCVSVTLGCLILLLFWLYGTRQGLAVRAVASDAEAASLSGIPPQKTVSCVFFTSGVLAAVSALLYGMKYPAAFPLMGAAPGLKAYTATVIGGIGSLPGAVLGGIVIGLAESLLKAYIETLSGGTLSAAFADGAIYFCLLFMLLFRPQGLLGKEKKEKV